MTVKPESDLEKKCVFKTNFEVLGKLSAILGFIILILFLVYLCFQGYSYFNPFSSKPEINWVATSGAGDFIGGVVGSLWSFAALLFVVQSLKVQQESLSKQSKELGLQREELRLQREESSRQRQEFTIDRITKIIYQQFEISEAKLGKLVYKERAVGRESIGTKALYGFILDYEDIFLRGNSSTDQVVEVMLPSYVEYFGSVDKSLKLLIDIIKSKSHDSSDESNQHLLTERDQNLLFKLIYYNFDLEFLDKYLSIVETVFDHHIKVTDEGPILSDEEHYLAISQSIKQQIDSIGKRIVPQQSDDST